MSGRNQGASSWIKNKHMCSIGHFAQAVLFLLLVFVITACGADKAVVPPSGPQLVQDVTLAPSVIVPTRLLSATPSPIVIPVLTSELSSPLEVVTLESSFVLVTPTLPPSKTPTITPTNTATRTATPRPTITPNSFVLTTPISVGSIPSSNPGVVPIPTAVGAVVPAQNCSIPWFFAQVIPAYCALNPPLVSPGAFLQFQNGLMLWVGQQDAIYVLFDSANYPRWQVYNDTYVDGIPDTDPAFNNAPPNTWQPTRGFGLLWRSQQMLRDRLGWAVTAEETSFTTQVQIASNGNIFLAEPRGGVYSLVADSSDWKRYEG